jgi:hypothetical protein
MHQKHTNNLGWNKDHSKIMEEVFMFILEESYDQQIHDSKKII